MYSVVYGSPLFAFSVGSSFSPPSDFHFFISSRLVFLPLNGWSRVSSTVSSHFLFPLSFSFGFMHDDV
jgi:hypothetical protein